MLDHRVLKIAATYDAGLCISPAKTAAILSEAALMVRVVLPNSG